MQITTAPGPVDRTSPFPTAPCQPLLPLSGYYSFDFLSYPSHNCSTHPLPAPEPTLPGRPLSLDSLLAYTTRQPGAALPAPSPAPPAAPSPQATDQDPDPIFTPLRSRTAHFSTYDVFLPRLAATRSSSPTSMRLSILLLAAAASTCTAIHPLTTASSPSSPSALSLITGTHTARPSPPQAPAFHCACPRLSYYKSCSPTTALATTTLPPPLPKSLP